MTLIRVFILMFAIHANAAYQPVTTVSGSVQVSSGTVNVANFPAIQTVSGSLSVSATGTTPVSVSSLPLPSGAATAANQTSSNNLLTLIEGYLQDLLASLGVDGSANPAYTQ